MFLRPANPADLEAVAGVHVRSWQAAYRGLMPDAYLDRLDPAEWARRYTFEAAAGAPVTMVAQDDGVIAGFCTTGPARDPAGEGAVAGEVYALYVDPPWWSRGVGRELMANARLRMAATGYTQAVLWVLSGNDRAERFYRAGGWAPDGTERREEVHGIECEEARYRTDIVPFDRTVRIHDPETAPPDLQDIDDESDRLVDALLPVPMPAMRPDDKAAEVARIAAVLTVGDPPCGFAEMATVDGRAHLNELSVRPAFGRLGLGRDLVAAACEWAAGDGHTEMTLTTFADIPFNAPWYRRLGFGELPEAEWGPEMRQVVDGERALEQCGARLVMRRPVSA